MHGSLPWFLFWMRPMMQTLVGMDYDRGLKMFKEWLETGAIQSQTHLKGQVPVGPLHVLGVRGACHIDQISSAMEGAFSKAHQLFKQQNLPTDGGMISVYHKFDIKSATFEFTCGFLVPQRLLSEAGSLAQWSLPAGRAFCVEHIGSYLHLGNAWSVANQIVRAQKLKQCKLGTFEIYKSFPPATPEAECVTEIYLPLRS
jgi:DNA gyrase inhibitor GyrI